MKHELRLERLVQQKPIERDDQWAEYEPTGEGQASCSCGFDTGPVPIGDARRLGREHLDALKTAAPRE